MSATKSELESPGGNRKARPEIQLYIPGKTKISKQEQIQNDENSQKRLLELINQKQKFRNERVANVQQSNGEKTARSRKNSEKNVPLKSTKAASSINAKMQETNNNEQLKNTEGKELPKKGNQNRRKNTRKKDSRQKQHQQDNSDARSDISRASTTASSRGGNNRHNQQRQQTSSKFQEFRKTTKAREDHARQVHTQESQVPGRGAPLSRGQNQRRQEQEREVRIEREQAPPRARNAPAPKNKRQDRNNRDTDTRSKDPKTAINEENSKLHSKPKENNRHKKQTNQQNNNSQNSHKPKTGKNSSPQPQKAASPEPVAAKSPEKPLVSTPQKTADWGDLMNEEDEGFDVEPTAVSRRDSWATLESSSSRTDTSSAAPRPSGSARQRPQKINEEEDLSSKRANGISVIRINPSQMSRVRKESEKYNASDSDGYSTSSRDPGAMYGNRARAPQNSGRIQSRPRGGGRPGYDPDYDRNINRYRGRNDDHRHEQERVVEVTHNDHRRRSKESSMKINLESSIQNFQNSHERDRLSKSSVPEKRRALDIFTELVTFHPAFTMQEKVFDLVWKGIFYREVELYRKKLEAASEEDASSITAEFVECLLLGVDYYNDVVSRCEQKFQFSVKYHENHGIKVAHARQVKMCLYLCQQFFIHMGDLSRYIEQLDRSATPRLSRKMPNSRDFYTSAKNLDPRHAKPHYQLGVLSTEQQRHFEAIIHYIRAASVEKGGGSGTAMSLNKEFEMARREALSFLARKEHQKELTKTLENRDVWFIKRKLPTMSKEQLNKRFKLTFLAALGRIFTGIDVALVKDFLEQAYSDLDALISMTKNGERPYIPAGFLVELAIAAVFGMQQSIERKQNEKDALMMFFGLLALLCRRLKNKLKSLMKSCPDGDIYIIGDGSCRLLAVDEIQNRTTHVYPNPGRTIDEIKQRVEQLSITTCTGPTVPICILHVGNEDSSTIHQTKPISEIVKDFRELVSVVKSTFPNAAIYFSEIFPRWDQDKSRAEKLNSEIYQIAPELGIKFLYHKETFQKKDLFSFKDKEQAVLSDKGKKQFSSELTKCIEKELSCHNDFAAALENDQVSALLPAMRILTEFLASHHQHSMFASQKVSNLESVGSCGAIFSELSNLICHKPLPVHVSISTRDNKETVNCIETVDLQGFRPLRDSRIGKEWYGAKSNRLYENTVRMTVISKALDEHAKEENRVIRVHRHQFMPTDVEKQSPTPLEERFLVKTVVPDTNCWIEKSDKLSKVLKLENLKLEVLVSLCVKSELEGLTKSEKQKVANQAKKSLELIEEKKLRLLTSTGVILAAGKSYSEAPQSNIRNDDIIKNSVKLAKNSVLLTDDKNLMLKSRSEKVPVMMVHQFLEWTNKA